MELREGCLHRQGARTALPQESTLGGTGRSFLSTLHHCVELAFALAPRRNGAKPQTPRPPGTVRAKVQWKGLPSPIGRNSKVRRLSPPNTKDQLGTPRAIRMAGRAGTTRARKDWKALAKALNEPAQMVGRTNTLKIERTELLKRLKEEGADASWKENETGLLFKSVFPFQFFV